MIFVMLEPKMLNISFCIAQALLLCAKYCLPPLHTCLGDSWVLASDKRNTDWLLNGVRNIDFKFNVSLVHSVQSFISQLNRFA